MPSSTRALSCFARRLRPFLTMRPRTRIPMIRIAAVAGWPATTGARIRSRNTSRLVVDGARPPAVPNSSLSNGIRRTTVRPSSPAATRPVATLNVNRPQ